MSQPALCFGRLPSFRRRDEGSRARVAQNRIDTWLCLCDECLAARPNRKAIKRSRIRQAQRALHLDVVEVEE